MDARIRFDATRDSTDRWIDQKGVTDGDRYALVRSFARSGVHDVRIR